MGDSVESIVAELTEIQKAVLGLLWYKNGWQFPSRVASVINMGSSGFSTVARQLGKGGLVESKKRTLINPERDVKHKIQTCYRLTRLGEKVARSLFSGVRSPRMWQGG
jgi:DNA-binding MarR family transcriptional regulator